MKDWYPKIFEDVKKFDPVKGDYLFVSELETHQLKNGIQSSRDYQSLLIDEELIQYIKPNEINHVTNSSVHPVYFKDYEYTGGATVCVSKHEGLEKVSPLVFSWESANNFTFQLDPMFLQTYGLTPRLTEKVIFWDDLSKPLMDIVISIPKSVYDFPKYSKSYVQIRKDYIQDYLMLRKKSLIQVYNETRIMPINQELKELLGDSKYFVKSTRYNHFRVKKISENKIFTEVTGYRLVNLEKKVPFSKWDKKEKFHRWSGFDELISRENAGRWDYVYVSDEVLDDYEQDSKYDVYPESGGVGYKNQWSVSGAKRVGRNHIKLELRKLYEGTPSDVIALWSKYSVDISKVDFDAENIVKKSKRLVFTYISFTESLSQVINSSFGTDYTSEQIIKIDKEKLDYSGWQNNESIKPITFHLPHKLSRSAFLVRNKKLHLFLIENLVEKRLREIVDKVFNIDVSRFKQSESEVFRSIKLLNLILNYISIANDSGLDLKKDSFEINARLKEEFLEMDLIKVLSSINTLRQLDSHQEDKESKNKMRKSLKTFGIEINRNSNNFLDSCETIYDTTEKALREAGNKIYA